MPQFIAIGLMAAAIGLAFAHDGKPRGPHSSAETLVSAAIWLTLLVWGGFFGA